MKTITKPAFQSVLATALLFRVATAALSSSASVTVPPGGLAVTPSGNDLTLSFTTTSPQFYVVQTSSDLEQWTNCQPGIPGDGTTKSVMLTNAVLNGQGFYRYLVEQPASLLLPQSTAFSILGYSCGGIKEQVSAGFDVSNGIPTGVVNLSTTCSSGGRGSRPVTHTASALVTWDYAGNVISATILSNGAVNPTIGMDGLGDVIYKSGTGTYLVVPVPAAPSDVAAVQSGDEFHVSWKLNGVKPVAIVSSTVTATPMNSTAPVLSNTVAGPATVGVISTLQPQTTYQITVVSMTIGGPGPASQPISVTTSPATIPPSAPVAVIASWQNPDPSGTTDTLIASWQAADPGNSTVDEYLVAVTGSDGGGTFTQTVSGATLTVDFTVDFVPNWSVTVQAHNAAGWGPVSAIYHLGGL